MRHLSNLKQKGLIKPVKNGRNLFYLINDMNKDIVSTDDVTDNIENDVKNESEPSQ